MSSATNHNLAQLQRVLEGCRKGLHHDLSNQLVALLGLLQLLHLEEAEHLSPTGLDYVRRLLGVGQRIQTLARTLTELIQQSGQPPPSTLVSLPEVLEEALAECPGLTLCSCSWEAPRVLVPRTLLHQSLALALRLLLESRAGGPAYLDCRSRPLTAEVELVLEVRSLAETIAPGAVAVALSGDLPRVWHERVECLLLRELVDRWGGAVQWQKVGDGLRVDFTLPPPR
jgi:hypothetical protein